MQLDRQRLAYLLVVAIVASLAAVIAVESEAFLPVFSVTALFGGVAGGYYGEKLP